jgi:hypothetical protein
MPARAQGRSRTHHCMQIHNTIKISTLVQHTFKRLCRFIHFYALILKHLTGLRMLAGSDSNLCKNSLYPPSPHLLDYAVSYLISLNCNDSSTFRLVAFILFGRYSPLSDSVSICAECSSHSRIYCCQRFQPHGFSHSLFSLVGPLFLQLSLK